MSNNIQGQNYIYNQFWYGYKKTGTNVEYNYRQVVYVSNLKEEEDEGNGNEHEELEQGITKCADNITGAI